MKKPTLPEKLKAKIKYNKDGIRATAPSESNMAITINQLITYIEYLEKRKAKK